MTRPTVLEQTALRVHLLAGELALEVARLRLLSVSFLADTQYNEEIWGAPTRLRVAAGNLNVRATEKGGEE